MGNSKSNPVLNSAGEPANSIFEFNVPNVDGSEISLTTFKGKKAYLIVNVASQCGLTNTNYEEMRILYERYKDTGLEILAFPCNNFAGQEPGTNDEILVCAKGKGASYPVLGKLECDNGEKTHPLYQFLKASLNNGILGQGLKWNFAKFLCDAEGKPVKRYLPTTSPLGIEKDILELLEKK